MRTPRYELEYARKIAASNAKFLAMTSAQKRVALAKDVLSALAAKEMTEKHNVYCDFRESACNVCALGALFVAAEPLLNEEAKYESDGPGFHNDTAMRHALDAAGIFTTQQLWSIEGSFEGDNVPIETIMTYIATHDGNFDRRDARRLFKASQKV